jgi:hypothetical protein
MTVENPGPPQSAGTQAVVALILGILGLIPCCSLLAPIAWFIGNQELKAIAQGRSSATGEVFAKIGMVLGMLGTLMLVLYLLWVFFMGGMAFLEGWMNR